MKYALKPSSRFLDICASNKIIMFKDEKSLFNFFHSKMKQDLTDPVVKSERYNWRNRHKPNDISASDLIGVYSLLVSSDVDFQFLSWSSRVAKIVQQHIGEEGAKTRYLWPILSRMRSLPCNWTLYDIKESTYGGSVMNSLGWSNFFRRAKREKLLDGIDIKYHIPESA